MANSRINRTLSLMLATALAAVFTLAWAQDSADTLVIDQPVDSDLYAASREVEVLSSVDGDVVAAGQLVTVNGPVTGDVLAAAQDVEIQSSVSDDVRAVGQTVRVTSPISGHIVAAGQTVTISQEVGDWAWLAGDTVEVLGNVGGDLRIRAREVVIDAQILGNVEAVGNVLNLGPNGAVSGDLVWRSDNAADISPDARIDGELIEEPLPGFIDELSTGETYSLPLNTIVAVIVLFLLFSRALRVSAERVAARPGRTLLLGAVVFLATPTLAIALFFTGIGVWLGFAVLFVYFAVLLLGVLTGLFVASDVVLRAARERPALWQSLAAIFVTVVVVGLLAKIPWVGSALVVAILLSGVGALCWNSWATLRNFRDRSSVVVAAKVQSSQ